MTRYELRRHVNSCVLPEPLSHEEVGLLMTWIEPIKEKTIDYDTLEAKLAVLLEGLRTYSEKRSLLGYFNEKFQFNEMLATSQKAPSIAGSFGTRPEVPPSSKSDSKAPLAYSSGGSRSPLRYYVSPAAKSERLNSKTIENLKEGIGELGKKIETMKKEQKATNPFLASRTKPTNIFDVSTNTLLSPGSRDDALTVLKQEFQQIGEKADKIRRQNMALGAQATSSFAAGTPPRALAASPSPSHTPTPPSQAEVESPSLSAPIPEEPSAMAEELQALRGKLAEERRAKADSAAELQAARAQHDASMRDINAKLASLETIVSEKNDEVGTLKAALDKAKDDALTAVESEKRHTDDLIKREEKLLNTLMRQLNKAQGEQVQLDEYADEIDKVYDSLERLYASLKSDSRPLPIAAPPAAPGDDETTQLRSTPSQLAARIEAGAASATGNPFANSPLLPGSAGEDATSLEVEPDVKQQLTGLKSELHALLRVLG